MSWSATFLLAAGALATLPALAQKSPKEAPTLLGRWETRQIRFAVDNAAPDSVLSKLDNPDIIDLNGALFSGTAHLVVEFRADSSYRFTFERDGQQLRTESGTFSLRHNHLNASAPASPDGSSFHDQLVQRLARRTLVLTFPMGAGFPGVDEEIEYRRAGRYPASPAATPEK